jgi:hypothetical protein
MAEKFHATGTSRQERKKEGTCCDPSLQRARALNRKIESLA